MYKDIGSIFKAYKFRLQEDIHVDNFKEAIEKFISHLKRETFHKGIRYNSFEDIKEQDNDDSMQEN